MGGGTGIPAKWERSLGKGRGTPKGILGLSPNMAFGNSFGDRLLCIQQQTRFWSLSCEVCKTNSWAVTGEVGAPVQPTDLTAAPPYLPEKPLPRPAHPAARICHTPFQNFDQPGINNPLAWPVPDSVPPADTPALLAPPCPCGGRMRESWKGGGFFLGGGEKGMLMNSWSESQEPAQKALMGTRRGKAVHTCPSPILWSITAELMHRLSSRLGSGGKEHSGQNGAKPPPPML